MDRIECGYPARLFLHENSTFDFVLRRDAADVMPHSQSVNHFVDSANANRHQRSQNSKQRNCAMSFLSRNHTIAGPGFSRWMVPPAALCVHLCIGQAYAFSVFNLPMTKLIGISESAPTDWGLPELGWIFSLAIFFLGVSSAVFGRWVEEGGPRRAMFTAALCWAGGFF